VRYPQGGGLTVERQAFREQIRMQAAERFAADEDNADVAKALRVHVRSVQRWRAAWAIGGEAAWCPRARRIIRSCPRRSSRYWRPNWSGVLSRTADRTRPGR